MKETLEENNNMSSDTPSGTSLAESVIDSENAEKDKLTVRTVFKLLRKWWMIPVYLFFAVLLIIFISRGDEKDLYKAHFKAEDEVTIGDVAYRLLSKDDKDNYIGSFVSTKLTALKDKKIATMRSYILYVSVFYSVQGVDDLEYVMDGKNSVYVKSENYEKAKAYFENEAHITSYKMTGKSKKMENLSNLENEKVEALYELMENGTETEFTKELITENYATRREIYGFFDDGVFCRAVLEVFRDEDNNIYVTTEMIDGKKQKDGKSRLKGVELPEELADYFRELWN
ncbi:MAG: hypothetical protein IKR27_08505 [Lachnospiraceae bacterium]|nr:hypothetical protein [Lachnospiraceae bacterium]